MQMYEMRKKITDKFVEPLCDYENIFGLTEWLIDFRWDTGLFIENQLHDLTYELDDIYSKMRTRLQELKPKKDLSIYFDNIKNIQDAPIGTTFVINEVMHVKIGKSCICDHAEETSLLNLNTWRAGLHFSKIVPYDKFIRRL